MEPMKKIDYTIVFVSDMKRAVKFYRDVLGLPLKFESPDWTEFSTGTTTLALHGGAKPKQNVKRESHAGLCSIGFYVDDLEKAYAELKARDARFIMPPTAREGEPIKLAVCTDPD